MRRVVLVTLLAFGCATVRQPAPPAWLGAPAGAAAPLAPTRIEPDLELWMEGTGPIDEGEAARARDASLEALSRAIADHGLDAAAGDDAVLVRARGVVRTDERKRAQVWSVIGFVVTVVVVVVSAILSTKGRSGSKAPSQQAAAPAPPRTPPAHPRAAPPPARPGPYAPAFLRPPPPAPVPFAFGVLLWTEVPLYEPPPPPVAPPWATPTEEWIAERGWFDGEELELMVTLVEQATGAIRWTNRVRKHVDPRDAEGVSKLLGEVIADGPPFQKTP
jgi:hypothetical protein